MNASELTHLAFSYYRAAGHVSRDLTKEASLQVITKAVETDEWVLKLDLLEVCLYYSAL